MSVQKRYKCTIIGDQNVGKTSILNTYLDKSIRDVCSTLGIDFFTKTVLVKGNTVLMTLWDTAGAERFHSLTHSYLRDSDIIIIVYDLSKRTSNLSYWLRRAEQHNPAIIGILGNKNDLTIEYAEDLQDILYPWSRQHVPFITAHCSSRHQKTVKSFFKRCLHELVKDEFTDLEKTEVPIVVSFRQKALKNGTCCS